MRLTRRMVFLCCFISCAFMTWGSIYGLLKAFKGGEIMFVNYSLVVVLLVLDANIYFLRKLYFYLRAEDE